MSGGRVSDSDLSEITLGVNPELMSVVEVQGDLGGYQHWCIAN